jgi:spermidine/putrescine-binding protein
MKKTLWGAVSATAAIVAAGALLLTPACSKKAEPQEETLRITCWGGYAKPYVEDFQQLVKDKYNVDVNVEIYNPTDQDEFFQAVKDNTADLISPPIELPKIPRFYSYNCGPYGLAYNLDKVSTEPNSWNVLWSPMYAGQYTINNNFPKVNVWISALALGYGYKDIFDINRLDRAKVQEKLNVLAKNAKSLWDGAANPDEFPELSLATTWGFAAQAANLKGGNWRLATPAEGGTAWIDCWYLGAGAKGMTKTLAEEWINFMLEPERQADVVKSQGVSPVMADTGDILNDEEKAMFHVGDEAYFKSVALWRVLSEETEQAFNEMWETAKQQRN